MDASLNIAFRVRVSVVCIQCEQTQRKKKLHVQPNKCTGETGGGGNNQSKGVVVVRGACLWKNFGTLTQINLKNMVVRHCTGKWELNG